MKKGKPDETFLRVFRVQKNKNKKQKKNLNKDKSKFIKPGFKHD